MDAILWALLALAFWLIVAGIIGGVIYAINRPAGTVVGVVLVLVALIWQGSNVIAVVQGQAGQTTAQTPGVTAAQQQLAELQKSITIAQQKVDEARQNQVPPALQKQLDDAKAQLAELQKQLTPVATAPTTAQQPVTSAPSNGQVTAQTQQATPAAAATSVPAAQATPATTQPSSPGPVQRMHIGQNVWKGHQLAIPQAPAGQEELYVAHGDVQGNGQCGVAVFEPGQRVSGLSAATFQLYLVRGGTPAQRMEEARVMQEIAAREAGTCPLVATK